MAAICQLRHHLGRQAAVAVDFETWEVSRGAQLAAARTPARPAEPTPATGTDTIGRPNGFRRTELLRVHESDLNDQTYYED